MGRSPSGQLTKAEGRPDAVRRRDQVPVLPLALRLWCDDTEQIAEFATRAIRVAVNQVNNDLESDVQHLVVPPNSFRPVEAGHHDGWGTWSFDVRGALKGHHIWTMELDVKAPTHIDEDRLSEKLGYAKTIMQERLEAQADGLHLWRPPPSPAVD